MRCKYPTKQHKSLIINNNYICKLVSSFLNINKGLVSLLIFGVIFIFFVLLQFRLSVELVKYHFTILRKQFPEFGNLFFFTVPLP